MTITITIDPETNVRRISAETNGAIPVVVDDSIARMADHIAVVREIHRNVDVDLVVFADVAYLGN